MCCPLDSSVIVTGLCRCLFIQYIYLRIEVEHLMLSLITLAALVYNLLLAILLCPNLQVLAPFESINLSHPISESKIIMLTVL